MPVASRTHVVILSGTFSHPAQTSRMPLRESRLTVSDRHARSPAIRGGSGTGGRCPRQGRSGTPQRSEEHTSELQSHLNLVCRLLLEKKKSSICRSTPSPDTQWTERDV